MELLLTSLRQALRHLYDPASLRSNPLFGRLVSSEHAGPLAFQELLIAEIEALEPEAHLAPQADAWRIYRILIHRFVEQFTQREVAANLGLSIRQLRREEQRALQVLGNHLRRRYPEQLAGLAGAPDDEAEGALDDDIEHGDDLAGVSEAQEMAWLQRTAHSAPTDVAALIESVVETTRPLLAALSVRAHASVASGLPPALIQPVPVRHALLSMVTTAARAVPDGELAITVEERTGAVGITLECKAVGAPCNVEAFDDAIEVARQLLALSEGTLDVLMPGQADCALLLRMRLPMAHRATVLVIDDNADTLHLYERYLAQSPYRFVGEHQPGEALAQASRLAPAAIVLDVMLPEIDGWELLGRLREAPATRSVPVIVSTILPQEAFALALGAAAFLRKPFTQAQLVATLARVLSDLPQGAADQHGAAG